MTLALGPGWETDDEATDESVEPITPRSIVEVATFKAFYISVVPARQGDYKLSLGIPFAFKDDAWKLSDFDGNMLEVTVTTLRRVPSG